MAWNEGLKGAHLQIASSNAKTVGILAGPGTGKTTNGLVPRIKRLLTEGQIKPSEILFLTFSRTAARDFMSKLEGEEGMGDVTAKTFHSFCYQLLNRVDAFTYLDRTFDRIILDFEVKSLLRDLPEKYGRILSEKDKLLQQYKNGWAKNPGDMPGNPPGPLEVEFEKDVITWLKKHKAILMDEVVQLAYRYLAANPHDEYLHKYKHIIVDEFQDLNIVEQKIVRELLGENASLCVAGDDDQSIYGFRNAFPSGIIDFHLACEDKIEIEHCYRCPAPILNLANELIGQVESRAKRPLICGDDSKPGIVSHIQWRTSEQERDGLAQAIALDVQAGVSPKDILVLIQSKIIGQNLRDKLRSMEVPVKSFYKEEPIRDDRTKVAMTQLFLISDHEDAIALRYWIGKDRMNTDAHSLAYQALAEEARTKNSTIKDVLLSGGFSGSPLAKKYRSLVILAKDLAALLANTEGKKPTELVELIFPADVQELREVRIIAEKNALLSEDVKTWRKKIIEDIVNADMDIEDGDCVKIMSLHKSKGLTSPMVYIGCVIDGLIPRHSEESDSVLIARSRDEDRRLLYVGITRSKYSLVISSCATIPTQTAFRSGMKPSGNAVMFRTRSSPFLASLKSLPAAIDGTKWLKEKIDAKPKE